MDRPPRDDNARRLPVAGGLVHLGRVAGVPIALHFSWFLIAGLITFSLAAQFRFTQPTWSGGTIWTVAAGTALLFFVTLLLHELSHALVARARGLPVRSITLFALGGLAHIEKDASSAATELLVAIVGPFVSFTIGFGCLGAAQALGWSAAGGTTSIAAAMLGWLGSINVMLAIFNLIPGYPLDGGRVLRAVLWSVYKDVHRATRTAARVGQVVAGLFIAWGLIQFFLGSGIGGLWLAFIGWFLLSAAQTSEAEVSMTEALRGVQVRDVMANDCVTVAPEASVAQLVDETLLTSGRRCAIVKDHSGRVVGIVTPHDVRELDRARWREVPVAQVMRRADQLKTVAPWTPVIEALRTMAGEDVNQLPVVADGMLEGIVSRAQVLRLLQSRAEWTSARLA